MIKREISGWLTNASINETKLYAPQSDRETLLEALKIETAKPKQRKSAIAVIKRELFKHLASGDTVFRNGKPCIIRDKGGSGSLAHLEGLPGIYTWKDVDFFEESRK